MLAVWLHWRLVALAMALVGVAMANASVHRVAKSGIGEWIDPDTPKDQYEYTSSRGEQWQLVMSDEFNTPDRNFRPEKDHIWTSIEKPDGVAAALEYYSHNMTTTKCDPDGTCYFQVAVEIADIHFSVWNDYASPPTFENFSMYYRSAMVQSWNKFCFQGGMVQVRTKLPGILNEDSMNPDIGQPKSTRIKQSTFYPTWPGVWMMGNLGRAIFSASNDRMWPFSYDECNEDVMPSQNQRISACDKDPGHGLNPGQGRGAPEIDIFEGGGLVVSSSIQVAPGMPKDFRVVEPAKRIDPDPSCQNSATCKTLGSNHQGVPASVYEARGFKSWYQGLRYGANNNCVPDPRSKQTFATIDASVKQGISDNKCTIASCPASMDVYGDMGPMDNSNDHWGINSNGTCFAETNFFKGKILCSRDNPDPDCVKKDNAGPLSPKEPRFKYQMDAVSANWPAHLGLYSDYTNFMLEWVMGTEGYLRWMLDGVPIFEIPASSLNDPPEDGGKTNPKRIMMEEPMYMILNVALTTEWSAVPPNAGSACLSGNDSEQTKRICDAFPLYLKIDHIRIYQDISKNSKMAVGCDPKSHPTKKWIEDHYEEYLDETNPLVKGVNGGAFCRDDSDCTPEETIEGGSKPGVCVDKRCKCNYPDYWSGPRCIEAFGRMKKDQGGSGSGNGTDDNGDAHTPKQPSFAPSLSLASGFGAAVIVVTFVSWYLSRKKERRAIIRDERNREKMVAMMDKPPKSRSRIPILGDMFRDPMLESENDELYCLQPPRSDVTGSFDSYREMPVDKYSNPRIEL